MNIFAKHYLPKQFKFNSLESPLSASIKKLFQRANFRIVFNYEQLDDRELSACRRLFLEGDPHIPSKVYKRKQLVEEIL